MPLEAPASQRYVAVALRRGEGKGRVVDLGPAEQVDATLASYLAEKVDVVAARGVSLGQAGAVDASMTAEGIWGQLEGLVAKSSRVLVIADGVFDGFPLGALPFGKNKFALEKYTFVQLDGGWQLSGLDTRFPKWMGEPLLVGGVDFNLHAPDNAGTTAVAALTSNGGSFVPLPGSLEEVEAINKALKASKRRSSTPRLLTGHEATEDALVSTWRGASVIHLATHGFFFNKDRPEGTGDALAPGLAAGIILSNSRTMDGVLTADAIAAVDGSNWELVVLSACHTARGNVVPGEGFASVRRAFHLAGAKRVVSAAWAVPDEDTRNLMEQFYGSILKGEGPATALRKAQLSILKSKRKAKITNGDPRAWGAFVLSGRYR